MSLYPNKVPKDLRSFIKTIKTRLPALLGDVLFGIYVYGSISYGDFGKSYSDVDIIAVVKRKLNRREFERLKELYGSDPLRRSRWLKRLEMDYVVYSTLSNLGAVIRHGIKTTRLAHGRLWKHAESDGGNPINWMNIRQCGITLWGPLPKTFVPKIDEELVISSVRRGLKEIRSKFPMWTKKDLWNQVYVVVTLCRIACALKEGKMLSKKAAARWGMKNLPAQFRPLARIALREMDNPTGPLNRTIAGNLPGLVSYVSKL